MCLFFYLIFFVEHNFFLHNIYAVYIYREQFNVFIIIIRVHIIISAPFLADFYITSKQFFVGYNLHTCLKKSELYTF